MLKTIERPKVAPKDQETIERIVVTPDIARAWLDQNTHNRKMKARHVDRLARDMAAGRFDFTGDAIRFDRNRVLIDGQHRLLACIKSGKPFETLVIYNLPPKAQDRIDSGRSRSADDILSLSNFHHTTVMSAACRILLAEKAENNTLSSSPWSNAEVIDVVTRHPKLPAAINRCAPTLPPRGISRAHVAVIYYVGTNLTNAPDAAERFLSVIVTGIPAYEGCPAHAYRERIIKFGAATHASRDEKWRLMKHAWNLFQDSVKSKRLATGTVVRIEGLKPDMI